MQTKILKHKVNYTLVSDAPSLVMHPRLAHAESALAGELHFRQVKYYIIKSIDANQNNYC